jgi:hypothetical protein
MEKLRLILSALLLAACGDPSAGDLFDDAADGEELGSIEQGMRTRFSSTYTHGVTTGTTMQKCTLGLGGGVGQACMLPSRSIVRYKMVPTAVGDVTWIDWQNRARQFYQTQIRPGNYGYPQPFGSAIEEDTANTWVIIKKGTCPGAWDSNNIWVFGCLQWDGSATTVTESLTGTYKRFLGVLTINVDFDKIKLRVQALPGVHWDWQDAAYELTEHVLGALLPAAYGSGTYGSDVTDPFGQTYRTWSSRFVQDSTYGYEAAGYSLGELCRMGYWDSVGVSWFEASPDGTCPNNN